MTSDGWISADTVVKVIEAHADAEWAKTTPGAELPNLEAVEALMSESNEGGGLFGLAPEYHAVRGALIRRGMVEQN